MAIFKTKETKKIERAVRDYFDVLTAYQPRFTSFEGSVYEMELTRAAIHSFAKHCSKLKIEIKGAEQHNKALERVMQTKPNPFMDTKKYLYRLATIYKVQNNAYICPLIDETTQRITGVYPLHPSKSQLVSYDGKVYLRYNFGNNEYGAIEFEKIGRMCQFQNKDELFGDNNTAFKPTLEMLHAQNQAITEGVKNSAALRFIATLGQALSDKDVEKERKKFRTSNLGAENSGGVLLIDSKYKEVKQIQSAPMYVDDKQMKLIRENVFYYFSTNEKILTNTFNSSEWQAYYEGEIEPFAIEGSLVHTNMFYSDRQIANGNKIALTTNNLQYASTEEKLSVVTQLFDRGYLTHNQGLEIFNMPTIGPEGDRRFVRKEYALQEYKEGNNANQTGTTVQDYEPLDGADRTDPAEEV